jgi:O-antigen/teichoic acid export membrane protein
MSRFKRFAHSLASGYVLLGVNILYTVVSVRLALSYLGKDEFGLWAVVTGLAGYVALIDFGMSGSVARILVDYKDESAGVNYGSVIQTGFLVTLLQGIFILGVVSALVLGLRPMPGVPEALVPEYRWLLLGQCALLALSFQGRTFSSLLWAHQRIDLINYSQIITFGINLSVLWCSFRLGAGLYSMLWGSMASTLAGLLFPALICMRLRIFPSRGHWGRPTWARFRELFSFGKDCFMVALGGQMVNATQTILVSAYMGLEAAAVWSVCTRTYNALIPLVMRVLDFSAAGLSEMLVRGEEERFQNRFRGITVLTAAMAACGAVLFALCNQPFVHLWLGGGIGWSPLNDILLGVWSVLMAVQRCHCGLMGVRMKLGTVKYIYFMEGVAFMGLAVLFTRWGGFAAIISSSILATFCLSFLYGLWRTKTDFKLHWWAVIAWHKPAISIAGVLIPLALVMRWLAASLPAPIGLGLMAGVTGALGAGLVVRWGLDGEMRQRMREKLPGWCALLLP